MQVLTVPYGLLGRLDSACVSEASDLCLHTYTRTDKVKNEFKFTVRTITPEKCEFFAQRYQSQAINEKCQTRC